MNSASTAAAFLAAFAILVAGLAIPMSSAGAAEIRKLSLQVNDIIYDPVSRRIYASVPSSAGPGRGNTITAIDPWRGTLHGSVFVGSEPGTLALSGDGEFLYVGLVGAAKMRRFHVSTRPDYPGLKDPVAWPRLASKGRR